MDNEHLVHLLVNPHHIKKEDLPYIHCNKLDEFFRILTKLIPDYKIDEEDYMECIDKIEKVITDFSIEKTIEKEINKVIDLVILGNEQLLSDHYREEIERRCDMHNNTEEEYLG